MKYHQGQCEVCEYSRPKPLDSITFLCFADTGKQWGDCDVVSKNKIAKRKCRYFKRTKPSKTYDIYTQENDKANL